MTLLFIADPLASFAIYKDTTFSMMREAQCRGHRIAACQPQDVVWERGGPVMARVQDITLTGQPQEWFTVTGERRVALADFDAVLMRKDPPFDMEFVYSTYLLEQAERDGVLIVNKPQSLRDCNEKLFATQFTQCTPPTVVSRRADVLREFAALHGDVILKPLDGMGGTSIFRHRVGDPNLSVILETLTANGTQQIMAQGYLPGIKDGDKRILMIDGEPVPYCLARIPAQGETRGNLAAGGRGEARPLSDKDRWIAEQVGPTLREKGLLFVGLDVIGEHLTEINVTSPTCIREIDNAFGTNIGALLMDAIERKLAAR